MGTECHMEYVNLEGGHLRWESPDLQPWAPEVSWRKKKQNEKRRKKKEVSWNRKRLEAREQMRWPRQSFLQWYLSVARFRDTAGGGLSLPEPGHQFGGGSSSYNGRTRGRGSSFPISGPRGQ